VVLDPSTLSSGVFDRPALERAIEAHVAGRSNDGNLLYKVLNLALWHASYIRNGVPAPEPREVEVPARA
jgi:hypothetical protein